MSTRIWMLALALLGATATQAKADCADQLAMDLAATHSAPAPGSPSDFDLYASFYQCIGKAADAARGLAALRLQLAKAGEAYISGKLPDATYRQFLVDRSFKIEHMRRSDALAAAVGRADADGDLIPDDTDSCPDTRALAPTDQKGCELKCGAGQPDEQNPACVAIAQPGMAEDPLHRLIDQLVPINLACDDTMPATSAPIGWGKRSNDVSNGVVFPGNITDTLSGHYFRVRRTNPQAPGCEVFYSLQFVFRNRTSSSVPAMTTVSIMFNGNQDEDTGDPQIARFRLFTKHDKMEGDIERLDLPDLQLSDGQRRLRSAMENYRDVSIRVRVITGAPLMSQWSAYVAKAEGTPIPTRGPLP
jgi:hypothetical protein